MAFKRPLRSASKPSLKSGSARTIPKQGDGQPWVVHQDSFDDAALAVAREFVLGGGQTLLQLDQTLAWQLVA